MNKKLLALLMVSGACGSDGGSGGTGQPPISETGTEYTYVFDSLNIPENNGEAQTLGLDLNDDGEPDNKLGALLGSFPGIDAQTSVTQSVLEGGLLLLAAVKTDDFSSADGMGLQVYLGDSGNISPEPCQEGGVACDFDPENPACVCGQHLQASSPGMFSIDADSPNDAVLSGHINGGKFSGGPGVVELELSFTDGPPLALELIGARAEVTGMSENGLMTGKIGGAVTSEKIQTELLPEIHALIVDSIVDSAIYENGEWVCCVDGVTPCEAGDPGDSCTGKTLAGIFDVDPKDGTIGLEEFANNSLVVSILKPDVDLLDADGNFNPNSDGEDDSVSLGVGFSAVKGNFTIPGGAFQVD